MGAASKFLVLLSTPFPFLYPKPSALRLAHHSRVSLASLSTAAHNRIPPSRSRPRLGFSARAAEKIHTQTSIKEESLGSWVNSRAPPPHPWPEWLKLAEHVTSGGYVGRCVSTAAGDDDDSFSVFEELPLDFVKCVNACLLFAREWPELLRLLSRKDVEVVVENGSPFLFKNCMKSTRLMRSFICGEGSNVMESDRARTVDVMRYLLSYASNPLLASGESNSKTTELVEVSVRNLLSEVVTLCRESQLPELIPSQSTIQNEQSSRPPRQNIEMKRGDWICTKCNFINFARNTNCLECNEGRPKRQLTGAEWECPQCDFFNYGRNMACLRCDCKRPGETPFNALPETSLGHSRKSSIEKVLNGSNADKASDSSVSQSLGRILGRSSTLLGTNIVSNNLSATGETSAGTANRLRSLEKKDSGYVPFVPLPADMFSKSKKSNSEEKKSFDKEDAPVKANQLLDSLLGGSESGKSSDALPSEVPKIPTESKRENESLASSIPDDDFPEIMPMRKGENRFVVSKKKDRSLTSPQYKRRLAMEQANSSNFVPFVPFPPDYFAKKDKQPEAVPSKEKAAAEMSTFSGHENIQNVPEKLEETKAGASGWGDVGNVSRSENPGISRESWNQKILGRNLDESKVDAGYVLGTSTQQPNNPWNTSRENWKTGLSQGGTIDSPSATGSLSRAESPEKTRDSWNSGFSGKSLEGSAVQEPDPLDMSEEAKAQRWFRRVAQIKDISELSQIPDEDFPQIMPMRKGVNRFVVSKRKTPLERRLTSPQYRRNLPIVSSEPDKDSS